MILLVFALVCSVLAAVPYEQTDKYGWRLMAAGLAFFIASLIFKV